MPPKYELNQETHDEMISVLEDTVEYVCDEHMISGELAWTIVESYATAKLMQFNGTVV